ncbi:MAG: ABC transporter permease [Dehalococcoidia bacterium]
MTTQSVVEATGAAARPADALLTRKSRSLWGDAWRQFRRHRLAMLGLAVFSFFVLACAVGPLVYTTSVNEINFTIRNQGPSLEHPLGTNDRGEDMLARILYGGRVSLAVGVVAMLIAVFLGTAAGALAGYFGGVVDTVLMRFTELLVSLPTLPLLLLIMYLFRDSLRQSIGVEAGTFLLMVVILGGLQWMPVARLVRAQFLSVKEKEFIEAARCIGASRSSIIFRHILPNTLGPVIVAATLAVGGAIITESSLSFLGLGFPPDVPTWGRLLLDAVNFMELAPYMVIFPALVIFLAVLSINYLGDGLRDALDPRRTTS